MGPMRLSLYLLSFAALTAACTGDDGAPGPAGPAGPAGPTGSAGLSCTVDASGEDPVLRCEDGTEAPLPSGEDGASCRVEALPDGTARIVCEDGSSADIGGSEGCTLVLVPGGIDAVCPDGTRFFVPVVPIDPVAGAEVRLLAGVASVGNADGIGSDARMDGALTGAVGDGGDFIYFVDSFNGTIRRFGVASQRVTTLAGQPGVEGVSDGIGAEATFEAPRGLAYDGPRGLLYINDGFNCTLRTLELATRQVRTIGGAVGDCRHQDGPLADARFPLIIGSAMSPDGRYLYLSDRGSQTIRRVDLEQRIVETVAGLPGTRGSEDGQGDAARFDGPGGIAFDDDGTYLYINDTFNSTIRRLTVATSSVVTIAGAAGQSDNVDGVGADARFSISQGLTYADGKLYVAGFHGSVREIDVSDPAAPATVRTIAGANGASGSTDGPFSLARFGVAFGILADPARGTLYYFDRGNNNIRTLDLARETVATVMGPQSPTGFEDGTVGASRFTGPGAVAATGDGQTYFIADVGNGVIRSFDVQAGVLSSLSGLPGRSGDRDGQFDATLYGLINDLVLSPDEQTLYVADGGNGTLRTLDLSTGFSSTLNARLTDTGTIGADGPLAEATFGSPRGLALTSDGNTLYVSDSQLDNLRVVDLANDQVTTLVPQEQDASGALVPVTLGAPWGLALNGDESVLYVADLARRVVWSVELTAPHTATVAAGLLDQREAIDGPAGEAAFRTPEDLLLTRDGMGLLVSDPFSYAVRRIDLATGAVSTVVGQLGLSGGINGLSDPLSSARLYFPEQLTWAGEDTLVLTADEGLFQVVFPLDERP